VHLCLSRAFDVLFYARVNSIAASERKAKLNSFFPTNSKTMEKKNRRGKNASARVQSLFLSLSLCVCGYDSRGLEFYSRVEKVFDY